MGKMKNHNSIRIKQRDIELFSLEGNRNYCHISPKSNYQQITFSGRKTTPQNEN